MSERKNVSWFKEIVAPNLRDYEIEHRYFEEGDFGALNQVSFDSNEIAGEINFWELGWLGIHLWDCVNDEWLLNVLLEPQEFIEQEEATKEMLRLLNINIKAD